MFSDVFITMITTISFFDGFYPAHRVKEVEAASQCPEQLAVVSINCIDYG